jgi:DUF1009 family protein
MAAQTPEVGVPESVGLLCGGGTLPLHVAESLKGRGVRVIAIGIKGEADQAIESVADRVEWTGIAKLGRWISVFKKGGVDAVLMLGSIRKNQMFGSKQRFLPDWRTIKLWYRQTSSKQDHTLLEAVANEFQAEGMPVRTVRDFCPDLMMPTGPLTDREPTETQWRDIMFAWPIVKQIAAMQIGQCIVVREQAVVAVEGIDGTDAALERGGVLAGGEAVAVKVPREGHDERFDIPCIGPDTADILVRSGVAVMAVEAGRTILLDAVETRQRADAGGVCIVAISPEQISADGG